MSNYHLTLLLWASKTLRQPKHEDGPDPVPLPGAREEELGVGDGPVLQLQADSDQMTSANPAHGLDFLLNAVALACHHEAVTEASVRVAAACKD